MTTTAPHRSLARRGAALLVAAGLAGGFTSVPAAPAAAAGCKVDSCPDDSASGSAGGGMITVVVTGSGVSRGGGTIDVPARSITVAPVCSFTPLWTGKEYYEGWQPGGLMHTSAGMGDADRDAEPQTPTPGFEQHKDDTEGMWWAPVCYSANHKGSSDEFRQIAADFFAAQDEVFVPPGTPPPGFEVPVEVLRDIASDEMTLPDPVVDWNPKMQDSAATVVNLDTWVWLVDPAEQLEVTATAGGNSATVEATLETMTLSAPGADATTCTGSGTPWTAGASSDCSIVFTHSSANQPGLKTPLTITTGWDAVWYANGAFQGALDSQTESAEALVPVAEVQSVIVSAS